MVDVPSVTPLEKTEFSSPIDPEQNWSHLYIPSYIIDAEIYILLFVVLECLWVHMCMCIWKLKVVPGGFPD